MLQDITPYQDKRRELFHGYFERALAYDNYGASGEPSHWDRWKNYQSRITLNKSQSEIVSTFGRTLNLLMLSGIWCGDCARQGPMLHAIASANQNINLRFIESRENPELQNELRINGAEKVPVIVALSEDFLEVARFGDKHLSVYRNSYKKELEKVSGAFCDPGILPPDEDLLAEELGEWIAFLERIQYMLMLSPFLKKRYNK